MKVNSSIAFCVPPEGQQAVSRFVEAAVVALNVRSDADLARIVGTSPGAVASWKLRGSVSAKGAAWFASEFVGEVFARNVGAEGGGRLVDIAAALKAVSDLGLDGFALGTDEDGAMGAAWAFGGLVALARFFRVTDPGSLYVTSASLADQYADALKQCMACFIGELGGRLGSSSWELQQR